MILVDGQACDLVPASDRGLNYADGLFETMRLHAGAVPLLQRHLARLRAGAERLGLPWPGDQVLRMEIERLAAAGGGDGVLKIVLTRGDGGRGYVPDPQATGRRILSSHPLPAALGHPLEVGVCRTRLGRSPALDGLKHLGRLEQVLAAREATAAGWGEGLMLDAHGFVAEGTRHHVFWRRAGRLETPPASMLAVDGVMRTLLLEALAAAGEAGCEAPLRYDALHEIEEMVVCNAVAGVRGVKRLDGRPLPESALLARMRALLAAHGVTWLA
ncbi:aminodeoxychorismate lyase [Thioalkalivibrio sp. XN279]|uniref:aminodeoxychorismate lyase n=1 Tax=Thioalkalivibrio sp. XN279 TaxID=2714953 RepID=UPI00140BDC41|nr:aminodeoxychorismate lyase [Thioalkalivibrio sp. XN279]NHA14454.1 aminodeoxychorismate lyase [Thioalkalivibrio sp. XN279]